MHTYAFHRKLGSLLQGQKHSKNTLTIPSYIQLAVGSGHHMMFPIMQA